MSNILEREHTKETLSPQPTVPLKKNWHRKEIIFLGCCLIIGFLIRQMMEVRLFPDSINYLTFARNILSGIHNTGDISFLVSFRRPPIYPYLIALFSGGNSSPIFLAEVARQISILFGVLTILPIYLLSKKMISQKAAAFSAVMAVLIPEFVYYSGAVLAETICSFFITVGFFLLWYSSQYKDRWYLYILQGFFLGLAFLCRHLAIGFLGIALAWTVISYVKPIKPGKMLSSITRTAMSCLLVLLAFFLTISPQVHYLHEKTGKWALAVDPFSSSALKVKHEGKDIRYTEIFEARAAITAEGDRYAWEVKKAAGLTDIVRAQPFKYLKSFLLTLFRGYLSDTYPLPYPMIILFLAALGALAMCIQGRYKILIFSIFIFGGYYLFLGLFLTMRDRYMFLAYPVLIIVAGFGAETLLRYARRLETRLGYKPWIYLGSSALLFIVIAGSLLFSTMKLIGEQNALDNRKYFLAIAEDLSRRVEKNSYIFDRTPHLPYFAGGTKATPPYAGIDEVLRFARIRGVRYWVVSTYYVPSLRPQYKPLLDQKRPHVGLRPIAVYHGGANAKIIVYEISQE
jgi:4-amino-4-deoxy-L-arabinose transferase-like glycosyltransferase